MRVLMMALVSAVRYVGLVATRSLHLIRKRLWKAYKIGGGSYAVFRETERTRTNTREEVVLVVGFRLKALRNSRFMHWLFQRVCILTTPFWSGFKGFRIKLWMVDRATHNYVGIYKWSGQANAQRYVDALCLVLQPLSTPNSVWYSLYPENFEDFVCQHYQQA